MAINTKQHGHGLAGLGGIVRARVHALPYHIVHHGRHRGRLPGRALEEILLLDSSLDRVGRWHDLLLLRHTGSRVADVHSRVGLLLAHVDAEVARRQPGERLRGVETEDVVGDLRRGHGSEVGVGHTEAVIEVINFRYNQITRAQLVTLQHRLDIVTLLINRSLELPRVHVD